MPEGVRLLVRTLRGLCVVAVCVRWRRFRRDDVCRSMNSDSEDSTDDEDEDGEEEDDGGESEGGERVEEDSLKEGLSFTLEESSE